MNVDLIILHFCVGGGVGGCWNLCWRGHPYTQHLRPQSCPGSQLWEKDWGTKEAHSEPAWTQTHCIPSLYHLDYGIIKGFIIVQKHACSSYPYVSVYSNRNSLHRNALPLFFMLLHLCMVPETNSKEKPRREGQTEEGLGHCPGKDHSSGCSGVWGRDVWYPFQGLQASSNLKKKNFATLSSNYKKALTSSYRKKKLRFSWLTGALGPLDFTKIVGLFFLHESNLINHVL